MTDSEIFELIGKVCLLSGGSWMLFDFLHRAVVAIAKHLYGLAEVARAIAYLSRRRRQGND